jgi:hypothetical protein
MCTFTIFNDIHELTQKQRPKVMTKYLLDDNLLKKIIRIKKDI